MAKAIQKRSDVMRNQLKHPKGGRGNLDRDYTLQPPERWLEIYRDLMTGKRTADVARLHGTTEPTVGRIRKRVNEYLITEYMDDIRQLKVEHSQRLWHIYHEAMAAWEASKKPTKTVTRKKGRVDVTLTTTSGDVRFLAQADAAMNRIREIWGANSPIRIEHSGELRVAGKTQAEANAELVAHVQGLIQQIQTPSEN